jgi:hypothetical protein
MRKVQSLFFLFFLISSVGQAKDSYIKDRINVKIAYCSYPWMGDISYDLYGSSRSKTFTPVGIIEANYGLLNYLETGAYIGFSMYERAYVTSRDSNSIHVTPSLKPMVLYGVTCKLQLLPLIIRRDKFFLDVYLSSKLGGIYFVDKNTGDFSRKRSQFDYGIYGGVALYPFRHWGFFYEYGYGNYLKWRAGLSLRY